MFNPNDIVNTSDIELEQKSQNERVWRDSELVNFVDHYQKPLVWESLTDEQQILVRQYRVDLLNYPQSKNFTINRPIKPTI